MLTEKKATDTEHLILESAIHAFSKYGYSDATIKQIAELAGYNTLTVFRHFKDKENLFRCAVSYYNNFDYDIDKIDLSNCFENLEADLTYLAGEYFERVLSNLDIIRVFIGEVVMIQKLGLESWYAPVAFKKHFLEYLCEYADRHNLDFQDVDKLVEFFVCLVTRRALEYNMHDNITDYVPALKTRFLTTNTGPIAFLTKLINQQ